METLSASSFIGGYAHNEPVIWTDGVFIVVRMNKLLDQHSISRRFEYVAKLVWCHSNDIGVPQYGPVASLMLNTGDTIVCGKIDTPI